MPKRIINISELKNPWVLLATGFGTGLSPKAPGTAGTLASLAPFVFYTQTQSVTYLILCIFSFAAGIYICDKASEALGEHDHGGIVWDEFVGMWLTMLWIPISLQTLVLGFILFRLFDILKPWPIAYLDRRVAGGFGIMIDDVVAGIFANIILHLIHPLA